MMPRIKTASLILSLLFLAIPIGTDTASAQDDPVSDNGSSHRGAEAQTDAQLGALKQEIEIMRRVVVRSLIEHRVGLHGRRNNTADSLAQAAAQSYYLSSQRSSFNSSGFYLPGIGVIYSLQLKVPTREIVEKTDGDEADAWEAAKRSLDKPARGLFEEQLLRAGKRTRRVIDEAAVDGATTLLLAVLAKHASHMKHLDNHESIVVAVQLKPSQRGTYASQMVIRATKKELMRLGRKAQANQLRQIAKIVRY